MSTEQLALDMQRSPQQSESLTLKDPPSLDGATYNPAIDGARLGKQFMRVWDVMQRGGWMTLAEIAEITQCPESSVSARLRDFRKEKFGGHTVERRRVDSEGGQWAYRLTVNR